MAHKFLRDNGYVGLIIEDDLDLADILAKDRDPYRGINTQVTELTDLFQRRVEMERLVKGPTSTFTKPATASDQAGQLPGSPSGDDVQLQDSAPSEESRQDSTQATPRVPKQPS